MIYEIWLVGFGGLAALFALGLAQGVREELARRKALDWRARINKLQPPLSYEELATEVYCATCGRITRRWLMEWNEDGQYICRVCQTCRSRAN